MGVETQVECTRCGSVSSYQRWTAHQCWTGVPARENHHPCRCGQCAGLRIRWAAERIGEAMQAIGESLREGFERAARNTEQQRRARQARGSLAATERRRPRSL